MVTDGEPHPWIEAVTRPLSQLRNGRIRHGDATEVVPVLAPTLDFSVKLALDFSMRSTGDIGALRSWPTTAETGPFQLNLRASCVAPQQAHLTWIHEH